MDCMYLITAMAAGAGGAGGSNAQSPAFPFGMVFIMLAILYFLLIRPQQKREKQRQSMIAEIKTGDRVVFSGGILGFITNVKDKTFIIKIADNVKVEVSRGAVTQVLEKGEKPSEEA